MFESQGTGKKCNRCNKTGLQWDKIFHKKTGKWKLENHKRDDGKWCNKPTEESMMRTKFEIIKCPFCFDTSSYGMFDDEDKLNTHVKDYHPNGEILTDLDYNIKLAGIPKYVLHYWDSDPHYENYKG